MLPQRYSHGVDAAPTAEEFRRLLEIRLQTLDQCSITDGADTPLPAVWRIGYKATIKLLGRDRDGSLRASVTVLAPHLVRPYVRRVRLVKERNLKRKV
jgi:hypothetical protein